MNNKRRAFIITVALLSPVWLGLLMCLGQSSSSAAGLAVVLASVFGIPVIAVAGLIVSAASRQRQNAGTISLYGYVVPALLVCAYEAFTILG